MGLFAESDMEEGFVLGRMSGRISFCSDLSECDDWALQRREDRLVLLRRESRWAVVDVSGSVFEFENCSACEHSANEHVSEH